MRSHKDNVPSYDGQEAGTAVSGERGLIERLAELMRGGHE